MMADSRRWRTLVPEAKYQKIRQLFLKAVGLDIDHFQHLRPLVLSNLILEKMLSDDYPRALDHQLWQLAKQLEKQLLGIETFSFQMNLLSSIPMEDQLSNLLELARNISKHRRQIQKMADLYARADLRQLHKQVARSTGRQRRLLLYNRNQTMAQKIHQFGLQQTTFAAIGAGHLSGKFGVL
ncbi:MAG: TraB/GumN family protein, partial [Phaeodactylibacter sp.]|nr:TraB/GumN family protein [Phaeodactylibacter sp.]